MQGDHRKSIENPLPVTELLARAAQGDPDCQYWAGMRYYQADGLPENPAEAMRWCRTAAEQGHARAQAFVAYCYSRGVAVPKNLRASVRWYRPAARQGYAPAQYSLGLFYLHGSGVRKNVRLALKWLEQAAEQGVADALVMLGYIFQNGDVVVQDDGRACHYYRQAAELGSPEGQYRFGMMLMNGLGTTTDEPQAMEWIDRAAAQGHDQAVETRVKYEAFVPFNPAESSLGGIPVDHPFPLRLRTVLTMLSLERPCYQAMARDLYEYLRQHPKDDEAALQDIATLLKAAAEKGEAPVTFIP